MRPLNILTWHVHGNYLYYLSHVPHRIYLPVKKGRPEGYGGRLSGLPWPSNVIDVAAEQVATLEIDLVLFQSSKNYTEDQHEILSSAQRRVPRIFLEHDPPREHPTDTRHVVDDSEILLVHVTAFNDLMWDSGRTPTRVVEHGVEVPSNVRYSGDLERGIVVVNGLPARGRRLGADLFYAVRERVPLDLVGIGSEAVGGLGEVGHRELPELLSRYRFLFNPIRYTSLGLAVCEAMRIGLPIVAIATTEMATVVENGISGFADTSVEALVAHMRRLLERPDEAAALGAGARRTAARRFSMERFVRDWNAAFEHARALPIRGPADGKAAGRLTANA